MSDTLPLSPDAEPGDHLVVRAGDELYAIPGLRVREVTRWRDPTPVPGAPAVIPGVVGQRGLVLPVVDLRLALGLPAAPPARETRLVVAQHEAVSMALLVDAVVDLASLPAGALAPPPAALDHARARLLAAVARFGDRPLGVLNLAALVAAVQEGG
ncbi:MAG TPA: chemotaxis protein CheW [Chloroflexaceae bacterium]|nr:chemotaxis protein CheW [Chloroflexaceae bacterium]